MGLIDPSRTLFDFGLHNIALPNTSVDPGWASYGPLYLPDHQAPPGQRKVVANRAYERWGMCSGTNIGAALREGNEALVNPETVRRFGTVWIMVLLSDGAAGQSDPVRRNKNKLETGLPFSKASADPLAPWGIPGQYGSYGLCPFGNPGNARVVWSIHRKPIRFPTLSGSDTTDPSHM